MGHITPEEKEKIIQLFNTQEVDNLLLVYNLLQGFGINILDCDWLIKPYITDSLEDYCYDVKIPMLITCYGDDFGSEFKKLMICRFYSWDSGQFSHRWEVQFYNEHANSYHKIDYLYFRTDKTNNDNEHYLEFIDEIKKIYYLIE
jgi:hypothetical protein